MVRRATAFFLGPKISQKIVERDHEKAAVNRRRYGERFQSQALPEMAKREEQPKQGAGEQFPVDESPDLSPTVNCTSHQRIGFGNPKGERVIGKQAVEYLQQQIDLEE